MMTITISNDYYDKLLRSEASEKELYVQLNKARKDLDFYKLMCKAYMDSIEKNNYVICQADDKVGDLKGQISCLNDEIKFLRELVNKRDPEVYSLKARLQDIEEIAKGFK
jgi:chromosome segregation ATPase